MSLRTNTVKISGAPSEMGWSQTYEYFSDGKDGRGAGYLIVVFSTIADSNVPENTLAGRELLNQLRGSFFSDERHPKIALKESVIKIFNEFFQKLDGLEISAAVYMNNRLYASCINGGTLSLYRDRFLVKILESNTPKVISAEGFPKEGDIIILASADLFKKLPYSEIKESLSKGLNAASDYLSITLHEDSGLGACVIEFSEGEKGMQVDTSREEEVRKEKPSFATGSAGLVKTLGSAVSRLKSVFPRRNIYVHKTLEDGVPVRSKKLLAIAVILTILLGVSVFFGVRKGREEAYKSTYQDTLSSAKSEIEDALRLKDVDIVKARTSFINGRSLVEKLKSDGITDPEITNLSGIISENEAVILGEKKVVADLWLDMTLIKNGFSSEMLSYFDNSLNVIDNAKETIIGIQTDSKKSSVIKLTDLSGIKKFLTRSDGIYALTDDGVYQIPKNKKVIDKTGGNIAFFQAYTTNIYLLDNQNGEILKSTGTDSGFSEVKKWTTSEKEDFENTQSFVVDGSAWVLTPSGIKKYSYGNNLRFELKDYPFATPKYDLLYTGSDLVNIYLLNKSEKTISVFNKEGIYQLNLISDIISETKDLVVTNDEKKIFLLTGEKLYALPLGD